MRRAQSYAALVLLCLTGVGLVTLVRIRRTAQAERLEPAEVIVVFGAAVLAHGPSLTLRLRTARAAELYEQGLAPAVVCSGGTVDGRSEPRAMAEILLARGVPRAAIVVDEAGATTRATLAGLRARDAGCRRVLAVSSPFHLFRIVDEASRHGIEALPCPVRRPPSPGAVPGLRLLLWDARQVAREIVAVSAYRISARRARQGAIRA